MLPSQPPTPAIATDTAGSTIATDTADTAARHFRHCRRRRHCRHCRRRRHCRHCRRRHCRRRHCRRRHCRRCPHYRRHRHCRRCRHRHCRHRHCRRTPPTRHCPRRRHTAIAAMPRHLPPTPPVPPFPPTPPLPISFFVVSASPSIGVIDVVTANAKPNRIRLFLVYEFRKYTSNLRFLVAFNTSQFFMTLATNSQHIIVLKPCMGAHFVRTRVKQAVAFTFSSIWL